MGAVSDGLLKSTGEQWPSNYTGRELRREQERRQRRAKKAHFTPWFGSEGKMTPQKAPQLLVDFERNRAGVLTDHSATLLT